MKARALTKGVAPLAIIALLPSGRLAGQELYSGGSYYTNVSTKRLFQTVLYVAKQRFTADQVDEPSMKVQVRDDANEVEMTIHVAPLQIPFSGEMMSAFGSQYSVATSWAGSKKAKPPIREAQENRATQDLQDQVKQLLLKVAYPASGELRKALIGHEVLASVLLPVWLSPEGDPKSPPGGIVKPGERAVITNVLFCRYPGTGCDETPQGDAALVLFLNGAQPRPDMAGALRLYQAYSNVYKARLRAQLLMNPGTLEEIRTDQDMDKAEADLKEASSQYEGGGPEITISLEAVGDWTPAEGLKVSPDRVLHRLAELLKMQEAGSPKRMGDSVHLEMSDRTITEAAVVSIKSVPDDADITADGKFFGNTPSTIRLDPGDHIIQIHKTGFRPWQRTVTVTQGGTVTIEATLEKSP